MANLRYTANQAVKAKRETRHGTEYLIAPVVAIKAGVMNEELVPHDEIAAHFGAWDGRPFVLGHPKDSEGNDISANHPDILAAIAVGQFFNSQLVDSKIKGEVWVDVTKAQHLGGEALTLMQKLEAGQPVEVSTAYWRDLTRETGEFDGQKYAGVARNLRPDHIAALLNDKGACSWADGCGVPRVNQAEPGGPDKCVCPECGYEVDKERGMPCRAMTCPECGASLIAANQEDDMPYPNEHAIRLADPDQFARVRRQNDKFGEGIHAIWGVKEDDSTKLQAIRFDKDKFSEGEAKAWLEEHDYPTGGFEPATDAGQKTNRGLIRGALDVIANALNINLQSSQEANMNELIAKIVEDGRLGLNEEELGSLPEALLAKIADALAKLPQAQETEPEPEPVPQEQQEPEQEPQANQSCVEQVNALFAEYGGADGIKALLTNAKAITGERKRELIADVAANSRLTEVQLEAMDEEALVALRAELVPADYSGRGGGVQVKQEGIVPLTMPSLFGENGGNNG